jgi:hypothetical protein
LLFAICYEAVANRFQSYILEENILKYSKFHSCAIALLVVAATSIGCAQTTGSQAASSGKTFEKVQMDRDQYLKSHRYEENERSWSSLNGEKLSTGSKSFAEVMEMRDVFLRHNVYDERKGEWISLNGKPRDLSTLTREQVKEETMQFARMHRFDTQMNAWVLNQQRGN